MRTEKLTLHIYAFKSELASPEDLFTITAYPYLIDSKNFILVETREVEVTVPDETALTLAFIAGLREMKKDVQAKAQQELDKIDDLISAHLQLTHKED